MTLLEKEERKDFELWENSEPLTLQMASSDAALCG